MLSDLVINGGKEIFLSAVDRIRSSYKSKEEWKKLFVDTGEFLIDYEKDAEQIFDDLALVLSKTNMEKLALEFERDSGYDLKDRLLNSLISLMNQYEIPHDVAYSYSYRFLSVILNEIQKMDPEKYDQNYESEWRKEEHATLIDIKERIEKVRKEISKYENLSLGIHSADEMELELRRATDNPKISISFFEIDDDVFKKGFSERRYNRVIYIRARCKEEAVFCIIHELWNLGDTRAIFVVDNKDDWERLSHIKDEGHIYIPRFFDEDIIPIENNTNVFIYTDGYPSFSEDEIELRPRMLNTLLRVLQDSGMDYEQAYAVIKETHGLYIPMKKKLFHQVFKVPDWVVGLDSNIKYTALLMGQWTDSIGDKLVAEELSGISYDDFLAQVLRFSSSDDPFVCVWGRASQKTYGLASAEISWAYLDGVVDSKVWEFFLELFLCVIDESERLYTYPTKERLLAQYRGERLFFSSAIRNGMVRSIVLRALYSNNPSLQCENDTITQRVLDRIDSEDKWRYFAEFFQDFCEIAPNIIITRLNSEFDNPTELLKLFEIQPDNFLIEKNPCINIIWGVEQFLLQDKYATEGLTWLLRLHDKSYSYKSNSPRDSLIKALCTWYNFSCFNTVEKKTYAASLAFEIDRNAWDIVFESLPFNHRSILGKLASPKYRNRVYESNVTNNDLFRLTEHYISLLINNADNNTNRWNQLIDIADELPEHCRKMLLGELDVVQSKMSDDYKLAIYDHLRSVVYKHRFYSSAAWATREDILEEYVSLMNHIVFNKSEYQYEYLFKPSDSGKLLDPKPYDDTMNNANANKARIQKTIKDKIIEFKDRGYSLSVLATICGKEKGTTLGKQLAIAGKNEVFNTDEYITLYRSQESGQMALEYVGELLRYVPGVFDNIMKLDSELNYSTEYLVSLYRLQAYYSVDDLPAIINTDDSIKKEFWKTYFIPQDDNYKWALDECHQYGVLSSYVDTLFYINYRNHLDNCELLHYFSFIDDMPIDGFSNDNGYAFKELLQHLQNAFLKENEIRSRLIPYEIKFYSFLEWNDMKCVQYEMKRSPALYSEIVRLVFKDDDGQSKSEEERELAKNYYSLFLNAKFCPGEIDGSIDERILSHWINDFKGLLAEHKQTRLFGYLLGRLLVHSPVGADGYMPNEFIRKIIEEYGDDDMQTSYQSEVFNSRGIYTPSAGKEELQIANRYKENADHLAIMYPRTASIYYQLYETYKAESKREREQAENG